jgi:hypothetical protein
VLLLLLLLLLTRVVATLRRLGGSGATGHHSYFPLEKLVYKVNNCSSAHFQAEKEVFSLSNQNSEIKIISFSHWIRFSDANIIPYSAENPIYLTS